MLTLTFNAAKKAGSCAESYYKFLKYKGAGWPKDKPFPLLEVLNNNGLDDAIWALQCCKPAAERDRIARLFACDCAQAVLPLYEKAYPRDSRVRNCIDTARRYALGQATKQERVDAGAIAEAAAWAAVAWAAVGDAAGAAALAAWDAAGDVACDTARDAARAAGWAARAAAGDARGAADLAACAAQEQMLRGLLE